MFVILCIWIIILANNLSAKREHMDNEKILLNDVSDYRYFEMAIWDANIKQSEKKLLELKDQNELTERLNRESDEREKKIDEVLAKRMGAPIEDNTKIPRSILGDVFDEVYGITYELIRPSDHVRQYSLIRKQPEVLDHMPYSGKIGALGRLLNIGTIRAHEIINEYTSENTRLAHVGDLLYWQVWLRAMGFSFNEPITEQEIVSFIVQHVEGLDSDVDEKLFNNGFKSKLGPHKLATVKRRIGSLSVFLSRNKWPNPCQNDGISALFQKLTKMYGSSKSSSRAITKDILDDMLDICDGDKLKDVRDKALLLFAWSSGGRRRSEVSSAQIEDLTPTPEGNYVYKIPKSKTDQTGKGNHVPVNGRAAKALSDWLLASGVTEGAIFRSISKGGSIRGALSPLDVHRVVRRRLKKAGYDEKLYGAHGLRSGFVTEAARRGKPLGDVMAMTTHRSVGTVMGYYQAGNINNNSASNLAD